MLATLLATFCRDFALEHATTVPKTNAPPTDYEIHLFLSSPTSFSGALIAWSSACERFEGWSWELQFRRAILDSSGGASLATLCSHPVTESGALVDLEAARRALSSSSTRTCCGTASSCHRMLSAG